MKLTDLLGVLPFKSLWKTLAVSGVAILVAQYFLAESRLERAKKEVLEASVMISNQQSAAEKTDRMFKSFIRQRDEVEKELEYLLAPNNSLPPDEVERRGKIVMAKVKPLMDEFDTLGQKVESNTSNTAVLKEQSIRASAAVDSFLSQKSFSDFLKLLGGGLLVSGGICWWAFEQRPRDILLKHKVEASKPVKPPSKIILPD